MSNFTAAQRHLTLLDMISAARTPKLFAEALQSVAQSFDFKYAILLNAPTSDHRLLKTLIIASSLPAAYVQAFDEKQLLQAWLLAAQIMETTVPKIWHLNDSTQTQHFPVAVRDLARQYQIATFATLAIDGVAGDRLVFWFSGQTSVLALTEINKLCMILLHMVDAHHSMKGANASGPPLLSARELQVVDWTAQGKTSTEIGKTLGLSDHTINAHLSSAIRKLDCVNRPQMVAKAMRLRLIN